MIPVTIRTPTIELQKFLKFAGASESGGQAKQLIVSGQVTVNGAPEKRRSLQLKSGDIISLGGQSYRVEVSA